MSWTICASSVQGTSHAASGSPCQDSYQYRNVCTRLGGYMVLVASDGCGTARHADIGANIVTLEVAECIDYWLQKSVIFPNLSELLAFSLGHAHQCLVKTANRLSTPVGDLAATCICLVVGPDRLVAAQIGDGTIIGISKNVCGCLFWPDQEYANVTHVLTSKDWRKNMQILEINPCLNIPDGWLLATDGIQAISCDYEKKIPVSGFVSVLIDKLRALSQSSTEGAQSALDSFLKSERVNSAVTDDKTLIAAFR